MGRRLDAEAVGLVGGVVEDLGLLVGGECGDEGEDGIDPFGVGGFKEADGPVGAEHEAGWAEGVEGGVEVGVDQFGRAAGVAHFGDDAGEFAGEVGAFGEFADAGEPGVVAAGGGDDGFGDVVEDEGLAGVAVDEGGGVGEVARVDEDVVDEAMAVELGDAVVEVIAEDEGVVGFVLDDVADAFEQRVRGQFGEGCGEFLWVC